MHLQNLYLCHMLWLLHLQDILSNMFNVYYYPVGFGNYLAKSEVMNFGHLVERNWLLHSFFHTVEYSSCLLIVDRLQNKASLLKHHMFALFRCRCLMVMGLMWRAVEKGLYSKQNGWTDSKDSACASRQQHGFRTPNSGDSCYSVFIICNRNGYICTTCTQMYPILGFVPIKSHLPDVLYLFYLQQIVTDQQTGQKIQIVTALEPSSPGKQQQFILANADYSPGGKVILTKQEGSPNKVILTSPDGSGVNQLLFASPDLTGQQIQVPPED